MNLDFYYGGFESERLEYRKLTTSDAESWKDFFVGNPNLEYLNIDIVDDVLFMSNRWVNTQIKRYEIEEFGQLAMVLKGTDTLIGTMGFKYMDYRGERVLNLMSELKPAFWRKGYGNEGLRAFIDVFFQHDVKNIIYSTIHEENVACIGLVKKIGYEMIELLKTPERSYFICSITKEQFLNPQPASVAESV